MNLKPDDRSLPQKKINMHSNISDYMLLGYHHNYFDCFGEDVKNRNGIKQFT